MASPAAARARALIWRETTPRSAALPRRISAAWVREKQYLRRYGRLQPTSAVTGEHNAYEEIRADNTGSDFAERMRNRVWRLHFDPACASAAGVCASAYATAPPVFNPSNPGTMPQPPYTPITPTTPSAVPGNVVTSPTIEGLPETAARSHRRTSVATRRTVRHRGRSTVVRPAPASYSYYYAPFGYGYGCAWQRGWDGYWFRTSPCS